MATVTSSQKISRRVSIDDFIGGLRQLHEPDFTGVQGTLAYLRANPVDPESLQRYLFWDAQHYTRNLIDKTELYELLAICWEVGQRSSIHNHKGQNCWMAAPIGRLAVQNYRLLQHRAYRRGRDHSRTSGCGGPAKPSARRAESERMESAGRDSALLLAPLRLLHCVFGRPRQLRRNRPDLHVDVREALLTGS